VRDHVRIGIALRMRFERPASGLAATHAIAVTPGLRLQKVTPASADIGRWTAVLDTAQEMEQLLRDEDPREWLERCTESGTDRTRLK
jgi:hypothetical protein